jgi:YbgC/YbaW family acyl-CoA thioester hydrolase
MAHAEIDLPVSPDECDAFGHLNQASFLSLFERARWEMLMRGPGMDVLTRAGAWPAVRKATVDYHAAAFPGDVLRFHQALTHHGRTSFTMRQTARRLRDDTLIATAEFVFVCVDRDGRPTAVPREFSEYMAAPRRGAADARRFTLNGVNLAVEVKGEGPAVLFIHGYPHDRSIWAHPMAELEGFRRIAPDLRGMGESDAPDLGYSIETYAGDLAALLDALSRGDGALRASMGVCRLEFSAGAGGVAWFDGSRGGRHREAKRDGTPGGDGARAALRRRPLAALNAGPRRPVARGVDGSGR